MFSFYNVKKLKIIEILWNKFTDDACSFAFFSAKFKLCYFPEKV